MPNQLTTHSVTVGDTLRPLGVIITRNGKPFDISSYTVKVRGYNDDGTAWIAETTTGVTAQPTTTFTASASSDWLVSNDHSVREGDQVVLSNSGGALPAGLAASTRYFARDVTPNNFRLAVTPDGSVVDITDAGTGTHSYYVVGTVQYDFQAADVDTAGTYWLWFGLYSGSERETVPHDGRRLRIEVVTAP